MRQYVFNNAFDALRYDISLRRRLGEEYDFAWQDNQFDNERVRYFEMSKNGELE